MFNPPSHYLSFQNLLYLCECCIYVIFSLLQKLPEYKTTYDSDWINGQVSIIPVNMTVWGRTIRGYLAKRTLSAMRKHGRALLAGYHRIQFQSFLLCQHTLFKNHNFPSRHKMWKSLGSCRMDIDSTRSTRMACGIDMKLNLSFTEQKIVNLTTLSLLVAL